jgi:hypothetical protein
VLLAGIVFVNLLVLRLNLQLDKANQQVAKLHAENANYLSGISSASASQQIQAQAAHRDGLVPSDPSTTVFIHLGR